MKTAKDIAKNLIKKKPGTKLTVIAKPPKSPPKIFTVNKKKPKDLLKKIAKIPVKKTPKEDPVPALVKTIKRLVKNPKYVDPKKPTNVIIVTTQNPKNPKKVSPKVNPLTKLPSTLLTVVPVGKKELPARLTPTKYVIVPVRPQTPALLVPKILVGK